MAADFLHILIINLNNFYNIVICNDNGFQIRVFKSPHQPDK